jgi:hypothetical protein
MRWLADECVDAGLVDQLREAGHDVSYIAETASGASDATVLNRANAEDRLLLTEDKDFGDLVFRSRRDVPGVVLLRLRLNPGGKSTKWPRLAAAISRFGAGIHGRYVVVETHRIRSRPLLRSIG